MDKAILVEKINELVLDYKKEGKEVCYALINAYSEFESNSYILALSCPWMKDYNSCYKKTNEAVSKLYSFFDKSVLEMIHSVHVFDNKDELNFFAEKDASILIMSSCHESINPQLSREIVKA